MSSNHRQQDWPPAGSEMATLIRRIDWASTPLGSISGWEASLRTAVTTALDSPLPTIVLWGPSLIQIYNDAYRPVLGLRHPAAMGQATRECWPEVWSFNSPIYDRILESGERVHLEDQAYVIEPSGAIETRYFTITYAPARDESGAVRGAFVVAMETTRRVLAERDNALLLRESNSVALQLRQMFDQTPSFIALLDGPNHVFKVTNAAFLGLVGRQNISARPSPKPSRKPRRRASWACWTRRSRPETRTWRRRCRFTCPTRPPASRRNATWTLSFNP